MAGDSDKNRCNSCGHKWFPAGIDRATACPRCGSEDISFSWTERYPAYAGCVAILAFVAIVGWNAVRIGMAWWGHR
ncbi:MAG TPA: hypothetical protein VMV18_07225 [bacterium]|nr:hypothetical protein [bacterium]